MIELLERQKRLTANQWKLICTANVADLLDFFDFFLIGYVTAALTKEWSLPYWQGGSRTAQRPAGATRSRKTEREVFQPQRPCDEGLVVAIFSRRKTRAAFLDTRPLQPGFERPRVSRSGHA